MDRKRSVYTLHSDVEILMRVCGCFGPFLFQFLGPKHLLIKYPVHLWPRDTLKPMSARFSVHGSPAIPKIKGQILDVFPVLDLLAHM